MSHYSIGSNVYVHKGKRITSIVSNPLADKYIANTNFDVNTQPGKVPAGYEHRPDVIANLFLANPDDLWYLCLASQLYDVFEDFGLNSRIRVPK